MVLMRGDLSFTPVLVVHGLVVMRSCRSVVLSRVTGCSSTTSTLASLST